MNPGRARPRNVPESQGSEKYSVTTYSQHYMGLPVHDFNADGWDDIPYTNGATEAADYMENPKGGTGTWRRVVIASQTGNEAAQALVFHPVTTTTQRYPHDLGAGDINGDGYPELAINSK